MDDVMLDSIEGKGCKAVDVSKSYTGSNALYLPSKSYSTNNCKLENDYRDFPCLNATSEIVPIAQEDLFYMDKVVTDVKQPHSSVLATVKDICIDEGKQTIENVLIKYDEVDDAIFTRLKIPRVSDKMDAATEKENLEGLKPLSTIEGIHSLEEILQRDGDRESSSPSTCATNLKETGGETIKTYSEFFLANECPVGQLCSGSSLSKRRQLNATERTACIPSEEITEHTPHFIEVNSDFSQVSHSSRIESTAENHCLRQHVDQVAEEGDLINMVSDCKYLLKEEKTSPFPETVQNKIGNRNVSFDHVELHDVVSTSYFESGDTSIVGNKENVMCNQLRMHSYNDVGNGEPTSDGIIEARTSFSHLIHGDSIPLEPSSFSGSITATHVPFSGSISFQSESSTTSARSFAFPILQPEWSSSPVRMAKANRRHLRWQRWKTNLICCKF